MIVQSCLGLVLAFLNGSCVLRVSTKDKLLNLATARTEVDGLALSCDSLVLSCLVLSCLAIALSCLVLLLSCIVFSCLLFSSLVLSYLVL